MLSKSKMFFMAVFLTVVFSFTGQSLAAWYANVAVDKVRMRDGRVVITIKNETSGWTYAKYTNEAMQNSMLAIALTAMSLDRTVSVNYNSSTDEYDIIEMNQQ